MKLSGIVILSTRPKGSSDELRRYVEAEGGILLEFPLIEIEELVLSAPEIDIMKNTDAFDWLVFTSINGVRFFFKQLLSCTGSTKLASNVKIAAIGNKTASVLPEYSCKAILVHEGESGETFAKELLEYTVKGEKVLLPTSLLANDSFGDILKPHLQFSRVNIYNTILPDIICRPTHKIILKEMYDYIIFTSASGVDNFYKGFGDDMRLDSSKVVSIGKKTNQALQKYVVVPKYTAKMTSAAGIFEVILQAEYNKDMPF
ncbi:MAG: uroporphyrinogen-III synthase [Bacteroidales bacterium]|nr:uroporphyrinogen-III synthase [Bacteroidales bacterium]